MRRLKVFAGSIVLVCAIFGFIILTQNKLSAVSRAQTAPPSMAYVPESDKIRPWFLGFHTAFADFLWIKTTLYYGGHLRGDRQFSWLIKMVDIVTRLNPYLYPAYEFGGLMLPEVLNNPNAGRIILERGVCAPIEKKWKLYFFLGMLHYKYFEDYESAAVCIATAAQLPGDQKSKLTELAESMFKKAYGPSSADRFLELMYATSENPEVRRYLMNKINTAPTAGPRKDLLQ